MRRWIITSCALVLASATAIAGWSAPVIVPGAPSDLITSDGGHIGVATTTHAAEVVGGAVNRSIPNPIGLRAVTAYVDSTGCLAILADDGKVYPYSASAPECAGKYANGAGADTLVTKAAVRARFIPGGYAYACSIFNFGQYSNYSAGANEGNVATWDLVLLQAENVCAGPLAVTTSAAGSYAVFAATPSVPGQNLLLLHDATQEGGWGGTSGSPNVAPRSVSLVNDPQLGLRAFVVNGGGGLEVVPIDGGFRPAQPISVSGATSFQSIDMHVAPGERFGVAIGTVPDGGTRVLSAVPNPDPNEFGKTWRPFSPQPVGLAGTPVAIDCFEGHFCGVYTGAADGGANVVSYANSSFPTIGAIPTITVAEGMDASVIVPATDPDGEAVWTSWTQLDTGPAFTVTTASDGVTGHFTAPTIPGGACDGGTPFTFAVAASDGVHHGAGIGNATIVVTRASAPLAPTILGANPLVVNAGAPDQSVIAAPNAAECFNGGFAWEQGDKDGIRLTQVGSDPQATLSVPRNVCALNGANATFAVRALSPWGMSPATTLSVKVQPFGPPEPPFGAPEPVRTQVAGTTETYQPSALHVCDGGVSPDVFTDWSLDGGLPSGTALVPAPGTTGEVTAPTIQVVSSDRCDQGGFELIAQNRTVDYESEPRSLFVELTPDHDPLTQAQLTITQGGTSLSGTSTVSGINCVDQRSLSAQFVFDDQGTLYPQATVVVPGPWQVNNPPAVCTPRTMALYAILEGTAGAVRSNELAVSPPLSAPVVGTVGGGPFVASCEDGRVVARAGLSHDRGEQGCVEQQTRWTGASGTPLVNEPLVGNTATAEVEGSTWDALLDRDLSVRVLAFAGANQSEPATTTLPVVLDGPFVTGRIDSDAPVASETGILGLRITLKNDSACAVSNLRWSMNLGGATFIDGRAQASGATASGEGSSVEVAGLSLPPGESTTVFLNVRPSLFGTPDPRGRAFVGETPISDEIALGQRVATSGCGCASAGSSGALAFAAAALLFAAQRRRRSS